VGGGAWRPLRQGPRAWWKRPRRRWRRCGDARRAPSTCCFDGLIARLARGYAAALPLVARALDAFQHEGFRRENINWCWLACQLAMDLWNDAACANIASGLSVVARERGALTVLPFALNYSAAHQIFTGKFDLAEQLVNEADHITTATGNVPIAPAPACTYTFADFSVLLAAWRGDRDKTYQLRAAVIADATARGESLAGRKPRSGQRQRFTSARANTPTR